MTLHVSINHLLAIFLGRNLKKNTNKNYWCSISFLNDRFEMTGFHFNLKSAWVPLCLLRSSNKEKYACGETHSLQLRQRGWGFCPQHFVALRDIRKGCQAEPRPWSSLHSYCKDVGQWRGKWWHPLAVIIGTAHCQASPDWRGWEGCVCLKGNMALQN